jgi:hypothetical protein
MKIFVTTIGSRGDVNPFLLLALKLKSAGHDVVFYASENFRNLIEGQGIRFLPHFNQQEYEAVAHDPDVWHYRKAVPTLLKKGLLPAIRKKIPSHYTGAQQRLSGYCSPDGAGGKTCRRNIGNKAGAVRPRTMYI